MKQTKSGRNYIDKANGFIPVENSLLSDVKKWIIATRSVNLCRKTTGIAADTIKEIMKRKTANPEQIKLLAEFVHIRKQLAQGIND